MTRQAWAAIVCLFVLLLSVGGVLFTGDMYGTRSPIYGFVAHVAPKADVDRAEAYSRMMRRQDLAGLRQASRPDVVNDDFDRAVPLAASYYPKSEPVAVAPISYTRKVVSDGTNLSIIVINHRYADGSVILTTTTTDLNTGKVVAFNLHKMTAADLHEIRFDPIAANGTQGLFLLVAAGVFLFTLATAYACLATPGVTWKWLWFIFIMAGIGSLRFDWLSQVVRFAPIDIRWGAAGYFQQLFAPAIVYINFPLGAVIYWLNRRGKTA